MSKFTLFVAETKIFCQFTMFIYQHKYPKPIFLRYLFVFLTFKNILGSFMNSKSGLYDPWYPLS